MTAPASPEPGLEWSAAGLVGACTGPIAARYTLNVAAWWSWARSPRMTGRMFHLAIPVNDLTAAEAFYAGVLGCSIGRRAERWIDFDFFGHQLTVHLGGGAGDAVQNSVDGDAVPVPHFGPILDWDTWQDLVGRLQTAEVASVIGPRVRFAGEPGEQGTVFVRDPSGNALEFKSFRDMSRVFATS